MSIIISFILALSFSFAQDNVKFVKKGHVVEIDSFIVSREQMKKFVELSEKNKLLEQKVVTLENLSANYLDQISYHKQRAHDLQKELDWSETKGYFKTTGGFLAGIVLTGLASYAAIRSAK